MGTQNRTETLGNSGERNVGIDLLKAVAILFVILLHTLGLVGVLKNTTPLTLNYEIAWGLESIAYCAVDAFIITTGFLYAGRKPRTSGIVELWAEVFFYSALIPIVLTCIGPRIQRRVIFWGFFPILGAQYWFFNQYFLLFLMIPFLNRLSEDRQAHKKILLAGFLCLSVLPAMGRGDDLFATNNGYSAFWFFFLFLTGSYIKKHQEALPGIRKRPGIYYLILVSVMLISRNLLFQSVFNKIGFRPDWLYSYTSPLVYLSAVCFVMLFSGINIRSKGLASFLRKLVGLTFSVYLIHDNPHIRNLFIIDKFASYAEKPPLWMVGHILATVVGVFVICCVIDYLRSLLFKLLRVKQAAAAVGSWTEEKWEALLNRFGIVSRAD